MKDGIGSREMRQRTSAQMPSWHGAKLHGLAARVPLAASAQSNQILPAGPAALQVGDITGLYLVDDEGTLQTVEVQVGQGHILGVSRDILGAILDPELASCLLSLSFPVANRSAERLPIPTHPGTYFFHHCNTAIVACRLCS